MERHLRRLDDIVADISEDDHVLHLTQRHQQAELDRMSALSAQSRNARARLSAAVTLPVASPAAASAPPGAAAAERDAVGLAHPVRETVCYASPSRAGEQRRLPPPHGTTPGHEPVYCVCRQVSFGDMIACDNQVRER